MRYFSILGLSSLIAEWGHHPFPAALPSELDIAETVLWELFCDLVQKGGAY